MIYYKKIKLKNGKTIDQHRMLMEQYLGRKLDRTEFVHHCNHDKTDNRIENLELMSMSKHASIHQSGRTISTEQITKSKISRAWVTERAVLCLTFGYKVCCDCLAVLPNQSFTRCSSSSSGLSPKCSFCRSKQRSGGYKFKKTMACI